MASERIPALATYFCTLFAESFAEALARVRRGEAHGILEAIEGHYDLDPRVFAKVFQYRFDAYDEEAFQAATQLSAEAIRVAWMDPRLWDARKTARTRRKMFTSLADDHIKGWMERRGMDPGEAGRIGAEGGHR